MAKDNDEMRREELASLPKISSNTRNIIAESLRNKGVRLQEEFKLLGEKKNGSMPGSVIQDPLTNVPYMAKDLNIRPQRRPLSSFLGKVVRRGYTPRLSNVRELIAGPLYQLLLYDRAPDQMLITPDEKHKDLLLIGSKFFDNARTLSIFSGGEEDELNPKAKNLCNLEGFEKLIAAVHVLGDTDPHPGNIMVLKDDKTVAKIDHGNVFNNFDTNFKSMISTTANIFDACDYNKAIENGNLSFDIGKYASSLKQMSKQLDDTQIENIISKKVDELKANGFQFYPEKMFYTIDYKEYNIKIQDFDHLKQVYTDNLKENLANIKKISASVDIVAKFSNASPKFMKGGWLQAFNDSPHQDPISYATANNIEIEGKPAADWAKAHPYEIDNMTAQAPSQVAKEKWMKQGPGKWTMPSGEAQKKLEEAMQDLRENTHSPDAQMQKSASTTLAQKQHYPDQAGRT